MKFRARMIVSGQVTQEAEIEAGTLLEAWNLAHPAKADPLLMAGMGRPVGWVELVPVREEVREEVEEEEMGA